MARTTRRTNNRLVYARTSSIHGQGLFARNDVKEGANLVAYEGPRVSIATGKRMAEEGNVYVFQVNRREFIDGSVDWNLAGRANHSCSPNAQSVNVDGTIWLQARRAIAKGEEITYDYGYSFRDEPVPCRCGSTGCSGVIVASRHRGKIKGRF